MPTQQEWDSMSREQRQQVLDSDPKMKGLNPTIRDTLLNGDNSSLGSLNKGITKVVDKAAAGAGLADPKKVDASGLDADKQKAADLYNQILTERGGAGQYKPEQVTAPTMQAAQITAADQISAPSVAAPGHVGVELSNQVQQQGAPGRIADPTIAPVERVSAGDVQAAQAQAQIAQAAKIDTAEAAQTRASQMQSAGMLQDAASGNAPSAAVLAYQQAAGDISRNQMGMAAQAHGTDAAAARRAAIYAVGDQKAKAALAMGQIRAGEMATARGQYSQALEGMRSQDVGTAVSQAGLTQQAGLTNAQLGTGVSQSNTAQANSVVVGNADRSLQAQAANASAGNARSQFEAGLQAQTAQFNAQQIAIQQQFNAGQINQRDYQKSMADLDAQKTNVSNQMQVASTNANFDYGAAVQNMQANNQVKQLNAGYQQGASQTNATMGLAAQQSNQGAGLTANAQNVGEKQNYLNAALNANGQSIGLSEAQLGVQAANVAAQNKSDQALVNSAVTAATALATGGASLAADAAKASAPSAQMNAGDAPMPLSTTQYGLTADSTGAGQAGSNQAANQASQNAAAAAYRNPKPPSPEDGQRKQDRSAASQYNQAGGI